MEKFETKTGEEGKIITGELSTLFRVLSNPDTLKILYLAGMGIENSTHAMEELGLTPKRYYSRLKELVDTDLVKKKDDVYRQTALGKIIYDRFLPTMGKAFDAREELELIVYLEGTELENGVKKRILDELEIPSFEEPTKVKVLRDYEDLAIEAIDLYDSAEKSVILASNYADVRVMEAIFRATERGITNTLIIGKQNLSSKLKQLRMMLSITFAKTIINFLTNTVNPKEFIKFIELPYTFSVMDGHRSIIEIPNPYNEKLIVALSIEDKRIAEKLTELYEMLWNAGEFQSDPNVLTSIVTKLNGETPHQNSEL